MFRTSKPCKPCKPCNPYSVVRSVVLVLGASLALAPGVFGQHKEQFAQAQKDNSAALKQYTWKSRTELKMKGESKNVKLE